MRDVLFFTRFRNLRLQMKFMLLDIRSFLKSTLAYSCIMKAILVYETTIDIFFYKVTRFDVYGCANLTMALCILILLITFENIDIHF